MRESRGTSTDGISCSTGSSFASAIADNLLTKNFELSELLRPKLSTAIGVELSKADCREQAFQATKFIQRETATEETFSSRKLFQVHSCLRYEPLDVKVGAIAILRCAGAPEAAGHPHGRLCSHGVGKLPAVHCVGGDLFANLACPEEELARDFTPTVSPTYEDAQQGSKTEGRGLRMCHASSLPEYGFIATNCNSRASTADLHPPFVHLRDGAGECKLRGWRRPTDGRRAVEQNMR